MKIYKIEFKECEYDQPPKNDHYGDINWEDGFKIEEVKVEDYFKTGIIFSSFRYG